MGSRPFLCAHRRLVSLISSRPLEEARRRRIRALRPTSMRSRPLRGRMRRPGASCAATKDACACRTCAAAEIPQGSCGTQAASSRFRHNRQYSRRRGRWLGFALGYRQTWLPTCAIRSRHRPKIPGAHNYWHPRLNVAHRLQPANRTKVRTWVLQPGAAVRRSSRCQSKDESAHLPLVQSAYLTLVLHPKRILCI